jgi:cation transport ATPase
VVDPVAAKRARIAKLANQGKRVGYSALGIAIVAFFVALATSFAQWAVTTSVVALIVACIVLPIPIVLGYGVRAAAREDRQRRDG